MTILVSNLGNLKRPSNAMAFRLGVSASEVLAVTPDSVPPEMVPPLPVTTDEANKARISYRISAEALSGKDGQGGTIKWLDNIRAANWEETALEVIRMSKVQYDVLVKSVRGRTGNPDAEYELELQWWGLWDRAYQLYKNPPSWLEQALDKVARFLEDFKAGSKQAWQSYADWTISQAGPLLRSYHNSLRHLSELKMDFEAASASGQFSVGQLMNQEALIVNAEEAVQMVRHTYSVVSAGSDIDRLVVDKYGSYSMGGDVATLTFLSIAMLMVAVLIVIAQDFIMPIGKLVGKILDFIKGAGAGLKTLFEDYPAATVLGIGAIVAMIALPFLKGSGSSPSQVIPVTPAPAEAI